MPSRVRALTVRTKGAEPSSSVKTPVPALTPRSDPHHPRSPSHNHDFAGALGVTGDVCVGAVGVPDWEDAAGGIGSGLGVSMTMRKRGPDSDVRTYVCSSGLPAPGRNDAT